MNNFLLATQQRGLFKVKVNEILNSEAQKVYTFRPRECVCTRCEFTRRFFHLSQTVYYAFFPF